MKRKIFLSLHINQVEAAEGGYYIFALGKDVLQTQAIKRIDEIKKELIKRYGQNKENVDWLNKIHHKTLVINK